MTKQYDYSRYTAREHLRAENMRRYGLTYQDIANVLHRSYMSVYKHMTKAQIIENKLIREKERTMKVKFKKLSENAVMPKKAHASDFCYDIVATSCEEVAPNVYKYGTGIALQIDAKFQKFEHTKCDASVGFELRSRSSVWKTGMVLSNGVGTIDEGYTGEICAVFYHLVPEMPRYQVGDRIGQVHIQIAPKIEFEEVDELSDTDRGEGGYGSTGK